MPRVVVRYRRPAGSVPPLTDVLGELVADGDPLRIRTAAGDLVTVAAADVVARRAVPARPVAASAVRDLEHAAALAWPGLEQAWHEGWLLRAGQGFTLRACSAVPLAGPAGDAAPATCDPASLAALQRFSAARGMPTRVTVVDRLGPGPAGWPVGEEVLVLTGPTRAGDADGVLLAPTPDAAWVAGYARAGADPALAARVLAAGVDAELGFARVVHDGAVVAIARGALTAGPSGARWLGISAVEVDPAWRRRGLATLICAAVSAWAAGRGVGQAYLQVSASNVAALELYAGLGFTEHHRYRYATAP